jgi:hypothetical protein
VWGRVSDPSGRAQLGDASRACFIKKKPSRALLGLDGSETRPYMGIGTFTPFFDANFFASW